MIIRASWEFDADVSDISEEFVDIEGLAKDLCKRELASVIGNPDVAEEFEYEVVSEPKLKPCPLCGCEAILKRDRESDANVLYDVAFVKCPKYGCRTRSFITDGYYGATTTEQDAIDAWNRRA